jgi:hypothetical protein
LISTGGAKKREPKGLIYPGTLILGLHPKPEGIVVSGEVTNISDLRAAIQGSYTMRARSNG